MNLFSSVEGEDDVFHFLVEKFNRLVVQKERIGRSREQEFLSDLGGLLLGVIDGLFEHGKIHERFAAEKVHFEDLALPAVCDEEIHRRLSGLLAHELAGGVIRALVRKAVAAAKIAVVADMNTERLYLVALHGIGLYLFLEQKSLFFEPLHVREDIFDFLVGDISNIDGLSLLFGAEIIRGGLVAFVQGAAAHVVDIVFIAIVENVYHKILFDGKKGA